MEKFLVYKGFVVSLMNDNIDTDIIIPKQFLKTVKRTGFEDSVFAPWRYRSDGSLIEDFPLNQAKYKNSSILVTGDNFGCGSSREHAAWALQDYGFRVVVAGGYSDIFYNNWLNNGNLPIVLPLEDREFLASLDVDEEVTIDLPRQVLIARDKEFQFEISDIWKTRLMEGKDAIDRTLEYLDDIVEYEEKIK